MNLWEQDADIHRFAFGKRLARIAADLMGVRGVRLYHDQALSKQPGGGPTPYHADQAGCVGFYAATVLLSVISCPHVLT